MLLEIRETTLYWPSKSTKPSTSNIIFLLNKLLMQSTYAIDGWTKQSYLFPFLHLRLNAPVTIEHNGSEINMGWKRKDPQGGEHCLLRALEWEKSESYSWTWFWLCQGTDNEERDKRIVKKQNKITGTSSWSL